MIPALQTGLSNERTFGPMLGLASSRPRLCVGLPVRVYGSVDLLSRLVLAVVLLAQPWLSPKRLTDMWIQSDSVSLREPF